MNHSEMSTEDLKKRLAMLKGEAVTLHNGQLARKVFL